MLKATDIKARERTSTQAAPVDLEHGRFDPDQVVTLWYIAVSAIAAGSFGGVLVAWGVNGSGSRWGWLASLSVWIAVFGALLCGLSYAVAMAIAVLASRGWWRHQQRLDDWHYAQLAAYEGAGGQQVDREIQIGSLTIGEPLHVYGVILHVIEQARRGEVSPWSSPALRGDIWYAGAKFGTLGKAEAERMSAALGQLGLIKGRVKGSAGELVTTEVGEALQIAARNYSRLRPGAPNRREEEE